jgi:hypothetical protein
VLEWLENTFSGRYLSHRTEKPWPPHSPDINPLDFFLWGYLKDRVYTDNRDGITVLKNNISQISNETCRAVIRNFRTRVSKVIQEKGKHLDHII